MFNIFICSEVTLHLHLFFCLFFILSLCLCWFLFYSSPLRIFPRLTVFIRRLCSEGDMDTFSISEAVSFDPGFGMWDILAFSSPQPMKRSHSRAFQCSLFSVTMACLWDSTLVPPLLLLKTKPGPGKLMIPAYLSVLDRQGRHNEVPQTRWL